MLTLALRHLFSRKWQTFLTMMGITLGTGGFVVISGFMLGFQDFLINQLISNDAHIHITVRQEPEGKSVLEQALFDNQSHVFWLLPPMGQITTLTIANPQGWYQRLESDPRVAAYSPQLASIGMVLRSGLRYNVTLRGVDPERQEQVTNLMDYMKDCRLADLGRGNNRVIVGKAMLKRLGAMIGDTLLVSTGMGDPTPFKVLCTYETGMQAMDERFGYIALADAQRLNQTPAQVGEIAVKLKDYSQARAMAETWQATSQEQVKSWDQIYANILTVMTIQDVTRYLITVIILLVAGFGIYNILNMTVTQKRKEIAILRAMGFDAGDVVRLFLAQGLLLGLVGSFLGGVIGYGVCRYLASLTITDPGGATHHMLVSFKVSIYLQGLALALTVATFASWLPARTAGRLSPIEIIRQGAE